MEFQPDEATARRLDESDALAAFRARFHLPRLPRGGQLVYFCGNSLGLQPLSAARLLEEDLHDWAELAVDAHFRKHEPWYSYHELLQGPLARIVGARPAEVVAMNGTGINLHLMLVSFYRPTPQRHIVLMEDSAFPTDTYAVKSQILQRGYDPDSSLLLLRPREGESTIRTAEIGKLLEERGAEIALVLLGGINYYTGQAFELQKITACAQRHGCVVGYDLSHAAGNIPLRLHDWNVDFAVWCTYKYLNAGPGAAAGCFVHERHGASPDLPRHAGWWGNDPQTRFRMHLLPDFLPQPGAAGWQVSCPAVLSMTPLRASLALFEEAGMEALRAKSESLTAYLQSWIDHAGAERVQLLTPREPAQRGCQLSLRVPGGAEQLFRHFERCGVKVDLREPEVIRAAPTPLYNSYHDVWRFGEALTSWCHGSGADR